MLVLLQLYALYKQATGAGGCPAARPGGFDFKAIAKEGSQTVLPGPIDCHGHLESTPNCDSPRERFTLAPATAAYCPQANALGTLRAGFTTVRDCAGSGASLALRKAVAQGLVPNLRRRPAVGS